MYSLLFSDVLHCLYIITQERRGIMTTVTVRVDAATKRKAQEVVNNLGFDLSSVTRAFYKQIAREQSIPLNLSYEQPNEESLQAIAETKAMIKGEIECESYDNAHDLIEAIRTS